MYGILPLIVAAAAVLPTIPPKNLHDRAKWYRAKAQESFAAARRATAVRLFAAARTHNRQRSIYLNEAIRIEGILRATKQAPPVRFRQGTPFVPRPVAYRQGTPFVSRPALVPAPAGVTRTTAFQPSIPATADKATEAAPAEMEETAAMLAPAPLAPAPWYKTPMGMGGIALALAGGIYVATRKKHGANA